RFEVTGKSPLLVATALTWTRLSPNCSAAVGDLITTSGGSTLPTLSVTVSPPVEAAASARLRCPPDFHSARRAPGLYSDWWKNDAGLYVASFSGPLFESQPIRLSPFAEAP